VLVGEFWAGLEDIRIDLIKGLSDRTGKKIPILPTGLGFHLQLPSLEVECTGCHEPAHHGHIRIAPATSPIWPAGLSLPALSSRIAFIQPHPNPMSQTHRRLAARAGAAE
jgi:hypothetical protein